MPYGLKGDLALEETIETGLESLQANIYAPMTAGSAKSGEQAATASASKSAGASGFSGG